MYLREADLTLILATLHIVIPISLGFAYAKFKLYKMRHLVNALFAARDELIMCAATGAISKDDKLFIFFYKNVASLIQATNTDFFTLRNFAERIHQFEKDKLVREQSDHIFLDLKNKKPQFQQAVFNMIVASQEILLEKSLLLRIIVKFFIGSIFLMKISSHISFKLRKDIEKKSNYEEFQFLKQFKDSLAA
jgi:hypothetical protein